MPNGIGGLGHVPEKAAGMQHQEVERQVEEAYARRA